MHCLARLSRCSILHSIVKQQQAYWHTGKKREVGFPDEERWISHYATKNPQDAWNRSRASGERTTTTIVQAERED
jgi:hypothetical protein